MPELVSNSWWALLGVGLLAGLLSGALGVGSGIVFVPALVAIFMLPQKSAQGTALAVMAPMALWGAFRYWRNPDVEVNLLVVGLLLAGALLGVFVGTEVAARLPGHWLRKAFAVFMVVVAVRMFFMAPKSRPRPPGLESQPRANVTQVEGSSNE